MTAGPKPDQLGRERRQSVGVPTCPDGNLDRDILSFDKALVTQALVEGRERRRREFGESEAKKPDERCRSLCAQRAGGR